jgi:UDP:flavonoid glycosyltransferase YjiC (YdhE family)
MKITIMTSGSRGDVQPYLALGLGLRQAGHQVTLATHELFRSFVEEGGLGFRPIAGDPQELLASEAGQAWIRSGRNSLGFLRRFVRLTRGYLPQMLRDCQRAVEDAELIVFSPFTAGGQDLAEAMGLPVVLAALQPFHPTRAFPAMGSFGTFGVPWLNWSSHRVTGVLMSMPFLDIFNRWRTKELGLPPRPLGDPLAEMNRQRILTLYGYSPSLIPRPPDWGDWIHVTGYWFLNQSGSYQPESALADFLATGEPPVYVGFGSMISGDGERLTDAVEHAVDRLGIRVVLQRGWQGLAAGARGDRIHVIDSAPHDWLFPRMAAVVHHGGAGTTAAGLRAGVPSLLVPHFADQFFWGEWVRQRGAGVEPLDWADLTGPRLAYRIEQALTSANIRARAAALGRQIRRERGVERAVAVVGALAG